MDKKWKEDLHQYCRSILESKIHELQKEIAKISEDASNETKSSMGDKYETGREMMMQEKNKLAEQLSLTFKQLSFFNQISLNGSFNSVKSGALVRLKTGFFYLVTSVGKISFEGKEVFVLSPQAPLAQSMWGKKKGEGFSMNNSEQEILEIL